MDDVDLNLLLALDALLAEASVTAAARRLGLSASAMSRTLGRLRATTGDPLLVRAGRGLVPTPHAIALRERVHGLAQDAQAVLRPSHEPLDLAALQRTFTLRANEAFVAFFSVPLMAAVAAQAPQVRLRFVSKPDRRAASLREGQVDLEIGVVDEATAPELRTRLLFRDRYVGAVRMGHPLLAARVTLKRYTACGHVAASPKGEFAGPVDEALEALGRRRDIRVVVPGFPDALRIARHTDLVALVPRSCLGNALGDGDATAGLQHFELPVSVPSFTVAAIWHPRADADPAQRWLRDVVMSLCREGYPSG